MSWLIEQSIRQQAEANDIDLLICTPSRDGKKTDHWSLARQELTMPSGFKITEARETGQPVDTSRNIACSKALQSNAKYILFYDADVIPPKHALNTLVELNMPIVGCVYRSRGPPFQLLASWNNQPLSDELLKTPQVVEVETIGMGFVLIDTRVLKKYAIRLDNWQCLANHRDLGGGDQIAQYTNQKAMELGYKCSLCKRSLLCTFFDFRAGKTRKLALSEDYYFCYKVREMGFKIYAATVCCLHENSFCYVGQEPKLETWLGSAADVK